MRVTIGAVLIVAGLAAFLIASAPANIIAGVLLVAAGLVLIVTDLLRRRS